MKSSCFPSPIAINNYLFHFVTSINHAVCVPTQSATQQWPMFLLFPSSLVNSFYLFAFMFQSFIKSVGLAPLDAYVEPRISIGNAVADREYSTGHFRIQLDAEKLALFIRNEKGRVIWKCNCMIYIGSLCARNLTRCITFSLAQLAFSIIQCRCRRDCGR